MKTWELPEWRKMTELFVELQIATDRVELAQKEADAIKEKYEAAVLEYQKVSEHEQD